MVENRSAVDGLRADHGLNGLNGQSYAAVQSGYLLGSKGIIEYGDLCDVTGVITAVA